MQGLCEHACHEARVRNRFFMGLEDRDLLPSEGNAPTILTTLYAVAVRHGRPPMSVLDALRVRLSA